jgi:pyruvate kinase
MDDGRLSLRAIRRKGDAWECLVETDGIVKDKKGVNLPDTPTRELTELTAKDIADIEWGVQNGVDFFALSFVRSSQDVVSAKQVIQGLGADTPLIAKIEKPEALSDLEGILQESFGVMVARGDLGVEAPPEKVPVMQKKIIAEARRLRKPVITATQMLESMITRPFPSRAEASDIANAVFDGTDAVMLSGETSVGKYPVESVLMMERITAEAEAALLSQRRPRPLSPRKVNFTNAVGTAACVAAESIRARCIIVYTHGGYSAALVSGCRPSMPIFTFGDSEKILRRLALIWGIEARCLPLPPDSVEDLVKTCEKHLMDARLVEPKDSVVVVGGIPFRERGNTNFLKTHRIGESG